METRYIKQTKLLNQYVKKGKIYTKTFSKYNVDSMKKCLAENSKKRLNSVNI